ncbi:acyl transferase/acyl hydrolase/lysophospholipase [Trichoderma sp. SZMC 28013]
MLMHTEQVKADTIDSCPVPGLLDDSIPTTGDVHLYADPLTYHTQTPILYADSEGISGGERLPRSIESRAQEAAESRAKARHIIKDKLSKTISWANDTEKRSREFAVKHLFPRILYTFSDVIVFIFREIKTFESEVFQLLISWAATSIDKSLNQPSKPHVIIVLNDAKATRDRNQWDPDAATKKLFNDHTKTYQQNTLRGIKKPEDLLRSRLGTYASLFESTYKNALWCAIVEFQEKWLRCSFKDGGSECANVRSLHKKGHQSYNGTILGQGDHQSKLDQGFFGHWIGSIQKKIEEEEKRHGHEEESSFILKTHSRNMETLYKNISSDVALQNYLTCACCIGRTPEHALPCGHIICTACVQWPSPAQVRYKPEEAGVRVLCLDGGGVRGIVELVILHEIEKALGGHVPIQSFFDLIVGTSAGGMIALGLGIRNLRIDDCLSRFKALCQKFFVKRGVIKHAPVQNIARFLKSLFVMSGKSIYRSKPFEKALREVFDENSSLYNRPQPGNSVATRVAVTTTLARDDKAAILTNYNIERKSAKLPCLFIRPKTLDDEIKVWEAARATSAAPPYFKPFTHQKTGCAYIDGAIHHHCPVFVADQERRLLWEDVQDSLPDITLSIGSGITKHDAYPSETNNSNGFHEDDCRRIRLNAEFIDVKLSLDDVESIDMLEKITRNTIQQNQNEVQKVAEKLIASCFYFETTSPAKRDRGEKKYQCSGRIRCRFYEDTLNLKGLGEILLKYYTGTFAPHFLIRNDDEPNSTVKLELPKSAIEAMAEGSLAKLPQNIIIRAPDQSSQTSITLYLYRADSYQYGVRHPPNISGFPRRLYTHSSSTLSEGSGHDGYEPSQVQKDIESQSEASSSSRPTSRRTE